MRYIKKIGKGILRRLGYELISYSSHKDFDHVFTKALLQHGVDLVLDVGANTGQFAMGLRDVGYCQNILSFEPMSLEHRHLLLRSQSDAKWRVAPRMALGDRDGHVEINIAANSGSSSLLPMLNLHREAAPESVYSGREFVDVHRLDSIAAQLIDSHAKNLFLKIDVQGYEWPVLAGATETIGRVVGILCEVSFSPLYAGEARWTSLIEKVEALGFEVWGVLPGFFHPSTGRLLQADLLFFRKP